MATKVTELALLRLQPGTTVEDADLRSKLANAKEAMESYTGATFYYLEQIEDPSLIYILGQWKSVDDHMNGFVPSEVNQKVLESLKDQLTVEWLLHLDVSHDALPVPRINDKGNRAGCYSIGRHFVKKGEKERFKETFEANKGYLQDFLTEEPRTIGGGWRVDKEEDKEEFVLLVPWKDTDQHFSFAKTEGFEKYGQIRDHIEGAEIKHAKIWME